MIIDKINIIKLEILSNMGKQLEKAHGLSNSSTVVFNDLFIIIFI